MPIVYHPIAGKVDVPDEITESGDINNYVLKQYAETIGDQGSFDVFTSQFGEGFASTLQGLAQMFDSGDADSLVKLNKDYFDEFEKRAELETNPVAGYAGLLTGSIADPVVLPSALLAPVPAALGVTGLVGQSALKGSIAGGVYGGLAPVWEEFGDSRGFNIAAGIGFGGALGAIGGVIARRLGGMSESELDSLLIKLKEEKEVAVAEKDKLAADELARAAEEEKAARQAEAERLADEEQPLSEKEARRYAEEDIKAELLAKAGEELEPKQAAQLVNEHVTTVERLATADRAYNNAQRLAAGGTKSSRKRQAQVLDDMKNNVEDLKATLKRLEQQLAKHNEAVEARKEIPRLSVGKPSAKYRDRIEADVKANRAARAAKKATKAKEETSPAKVEMKVAVPEAETAKAIDLPVAPTKAIDVVTPPVQAQTAQPTVQTPQPTQTAQPTAQSSQPVRVPEQEPLKSPMSAAVQGQITTPESQLPLGLQPRGTSVGSMEVPPSTRFAAEASEGQDIPKLMESVETSRPIQKAEAEGLGKLRDDGIERTPQEQARAVLRNQAAKLQRNALSGDNEFSGVYTEAEIARMAAELESKIGDDYDSLVDYLIERAERMKTEGSFLNAAEIFMLRPLIEGAHDGIRQGMTKLRSLKRAGKLDSVEGLRALEEFQLYTYLSQIDLANKSAASAAMRAYKMVKKHRNNIDAQVKAKRPVDNLFIGKC